MTHLRSMMLAIAILTFLASGTSADDAEAVALFESANELFDEATDLLDDDPSEARELFAQAALTYQACIEATGVESYRLHVNAGNAHLLAGDVGRAIVSYRRAERIRPDDERVRAGLEHARSLVRTGVAPDLDRRALDAVLWWRGHVPRSVILAVGALAYLLTWGSLLLGRLGIRAARGLAPVGAGIALLSLGSLALEHVVIEARNDAVVVDEAVGRNGPDRLAYETTFQSPLSTGVEVTILETRDRWCRVRLADGRTTWVPVETIERI